MPKTADLEATITRLAARVQELEAGQWVDPAVLSIAENSPSTILLLDPECRIEYINHTESALSPEGVRGHQVYEFIDPSFHDAMRAAYARVAKTGAPDRYEVSYLSRRGRTSWWESTVGAVIRGGEFVGFAVVSTNVTLQRCRAASEERFFNLSLDMLCVAGFDGYFKRLNPAFHATLGYDTELFERPFTDFIHPDDVQSTVDVMHELVGGAVVIDFENRYRNKHGDYRILSWRGVADEATQSIYAVAQDVTDKKNLEDQLRQAQKMDAVGKLAGGVAHDFNNLLLAIQGNIELAMEAPDGKDLLEQALDATQRAARLTQQLLTFSRRQAIQPVCLDFGALTRRLMDMLARLLPESVEIHLSGDEFVHPVLGDRSQLEQVVMNLCVNARDAMPEGGRLDIQLQRVRRGAFPHATNSLRGADPSAVQSEMAEYVCLEVRDSGCGMTPEVKSHAFEPFFTTKQSSKGTGLGLATVYGIVQGHHGLIELESEPAEGSTFRVFLPASQQRLAEERMPPERLEPKGKGTILVAEDEEAVRLVVVRTLQQTGYEVLEAKDGLAAIELFQEHGERVDLVLLDVVMPGMRGPAVAAVLREIQPGVKILFTSGHMGENEAPEQRIQEQCLSKPYRRLDLLQRVRALLESGA